MKNVMLREVAEFINGYAFKPTDWNGRGRKIIRIQNLTDKTKPYNRTDLQVPSKYLVQRGDILVSWSATLGVFEWSDEPALLNQHIFKVVPRQESVDRDYLRTALNQALRDMEKHLHGATMRHVNRGEFLDTCIPLPPLKEQKRIAAILDKADALRRKRAEAFRLTDDFLQSVFLDMFGDPVTNPKGWKLMRLDDAAEIITGYAFPSSEYSKSDNGLRLCRGANVLPGRLDWSDLALWSAEGAADLEKFALKVNDIVLAMDRPWISTGFKIAQISDADLPALLVQRVARIRGKAGVSNSFLYELLRLPHFERHCRPTETTVPHISPLELRAFNFPSPPLELIRKFESVSACIRSLNGNELSSEKAIEHLFDSSVQRAFRGEL